jgi:hypothetical protein
MLLRLTTGTARLHNAMTVADYSSHGTPVPGH